MKIRGRLLSFPVYLLFIAASFSFLARRPFFIENTENGRISWEEFAMLMLYFSFLWILTRFTVMTLSGGRRRKSDGIEILEAEEEGQNVSDVVAPVETVKIEPAERSKGRAAKTKRSVKNRSKKENLRDAVRKEKKQ